MPGERDAIEKEQNFLRVFLFIDFYHINKVPIITYQKKSKPTSLVRVDQRDKHIVSLGHDFVKSR